MLRRTLLFGLSALPATRAFGLSSEQIPDTEVALPPLEINSADFAQAWDLVSGSDATLVAADQDLPDGYAEGYGNVVFSKREEIDRFFINKTGDDFINFFNGKIAGKAFWAGKRIVGRDARSNFDAYWSNVVRREPITAMHFIAYMSVFINEIEGNLKSRTESYGAKGHPGIAYLFNTVAMTSANGRRWRKKSYNTNKHMLELLNDDLFLSNRKALRYADLLAYTNDEVWKGDAYPRDRFPTSGDISETGIILEGDFFKFRGRGLIQTTWRANYKQLADYSIKNSSASAAVSKFFDAYRGLTPDQICTISTNEEWDNLFNDKDRTILTAAVQIHAKSGKYLPLSSKSSDLNGGAAQVGSLRKMGDGIGGRGYGANLKARVRQICMAMGEP